ncbi:MAG TPA: nickel-dependent lactate racemase [Polyangiaceae bacterium]|jgi:nickel-dependent lactate racemase
MRLELDDLPGYEKIPAVEIPDDNLMGVWEPKRIPGVDEPRVLREGLEHPHGAARLRDAARGRKNALLVIDDGTRSTPMDRILPSVIDELHAAGIEDAQIRILTAQGTHRKMSDGELAKKLGALMGRYEVHQHDWKKSRLHDFGKTTDGTPVRANALLVDSDFIVGVGAIVPHRVKGLSGGAKIIFPGVSGPEMMERQQWEASMQMSETVMGVPENSMRLRMEEAAKMAGLAYIVNVVSECSGKIAGCFVGDPVAAHRAGSVLSREINAARMPRRADIVIIDSYPADRDLWQSAKGFYAGTMAVRDGGTLVMISPNPEGVASNHPNLLEIGYRPHAELVAMVQKGGIDDLVGVAILADVAQIIDKADCILASPGVSAKDCKKLGLRHAHDGARALEMALEKQGAKASIAVLRHGGHILPLADARAAAALQMTSAAGSV